MGFINKQIRHYMMKKERKYYAEEAYLNTIVRYPPRSVTIGITSKCSNKCVFCAYHSEDAREVSKVYNIKYEVSKDMFIKMVDFFYKGRVPWVHICGTGEPFYHPDILELIDYASKVYGETSIQTSFPKQIFERNNFTRQIIARKNKIKYITTDLFSPTGNMHNEVKLGTNFEFILNQLKRITDETEIQIHGHFILTHDTYRELYDLISEIRLNKIRCVIDVVNLHSYGFNEWTNADKEYVKNNGSHITETLLRCKEFAASLGYTLNIPSPKERKKTCHSLWDRIQIWPVTGCDNDRLAENIIIGGCNAVVLGNINSLGYLFDYKSVMDMWNNEFFTEARNKILNKEYLDPYCESCVYFDRDLV